MDKFVNSGDKKYDDIKDILKTTAASMINVLNQYQSKSSVEIPKEILKETKDEIAS